VEKSGVYPNGILIVRGGNKISWVKWSVVYQNKSQGGLGVRDIKIVNLSLLAKWR
jgi:hypothetical protein